MLSEATKEAMTIYSRFRWIEGAEDEVTKLCKERNIKESLFGGRCGDGQEEAYLAVVKQVWKKYHTTNQFQVGDKVYVDPGKPYCGTFKNYIRATITEAGDEKWGYHLRAFQQDLPGIYMFNIWDKDLLLRKDKSNKKLPT